MTDPFTVAAPQPEKNEFQRFHDEMRQLRRRAFVRRDKGTYVREKTDAPKGKKAIRAAKRKRVRQMKEAANVS